VPRDQLLCLPEPLTPLKGYCEGKHKKTAKVSCTRPKRSIPDQMCKARAYLLVEQRGQVVLASRALEQLHQQQVAIRADVGRCEFRRKLVLARSHLTVTGLNRDTQLPAVNLELMQAVQEASGNRAAEERNARKMKR
jgi:hypothetical protein